MEDNVNMELSELFLFDPDIMLEKLNLFEKKKNTVLILTKMYNEN